MDIIVLFFISIPVFYVMGIIHLVSMIRGKKTSASANQVVEYLRTAVHELEIKIKNNPRQTVAELHDEYTKQLSQLESSSITPTINQPELTTAHPIPTHSESQSNDEISFDIANWYSNNSITLLLYLGAFMIVASASLFVSFQWDTMPGVIKAGLLTLLTIIFYATGLKFYSIPKIKTAGFTFISIGSLLIPFCGVAWHVFVLKDSSYGITWLITSIIAAMIYALLAILLKNKFYGYITSFSVISLFLSSINTLSLPNDFYILAGISASFVLLIASTYISDEEYKDEFSTPMRITSTILMPLSILQGFFVGIISGEIISLQSSIALTVAAAYYLYSYALTKSAEYILAAAVLLPIGLIIFCEWIGQSRLLTIYIMQVIAWIYLLISYEIRELNQESDMVLVTGTTISILGYPAIYMLNPADIHYPIFAFLPVINFLYIIYARKAESILLGIPFFLAAGIYETYSKVAGITSSYELLAAIYVLMGVLSYLGVIVYRNNSARLSAGIISTGLFFFLATILGFNNTLLMLVISAVVSVIFIYSAVLFSRLELTYAGVFSLACGVYFFIQYTDISSQYVSLIYAITAYILYGFSMTSPSRLFNEISKSALIISFCTPLLYAFVNLGDIFIFSSQKELFPLISAYMCIGLFTLETMKKKSWSLGYFTSTIGISTFLWTLSYIHIERVMIYTVPLSLYFIAIAYTRKLMNDIPSYNLLNIIGLLILLTVPFFLSQSINSTYYTFILLALSTLVLFYGISINDKVFIYGGIAGLLAGVIPQTYAYVMLLPRWILVGSIGFFFLCLAIYLLLKREEHS